LRPAVKRLGKVRGAIVDALDASGGELTLREIADVLHRKRPRDIKRRNLPMLEDAGILTVDGDVVTLADTWLEAVDDQRRLGGEIDTRVVLALEDGSVKELTVEGAETIALRRLDLKRKAYHRRHRVEPDHHYANVGADGFIEDLTEPSKGNNVTITPERESEVSPLAAAVRDYLNRSPKDACEPGGWIGSTLWALDLFDGKPTPQDVRAAIDELGGESYLRERLEASRGAA